MKGFATELLVYDTPETYTKYPRSSVFHDCGRAKHGGVRGRRCPFPSPSPHALRHAHKKSRTQNVRRSQRACASVFEACQRYAVEEQGWGAR